MNVFTNLKNAIRNIGRPGQHNLVKVLCLGLGLAVGSLLIALVYFEQSYDTFFPGHARTYIINEQILRDGEIKEFPQTSGAISQAVKRYCPQVETATRFSQFFYKETFYTADKKRITTDVFLADSCFFDVIPGRVLQGNAKEVLSRPFYCMVNRKLAEELGGDVVGMVLQSKSTDELKLVIGGVYEDMPLNSELKDLRIVGSLATLKKLYNGNADGTELWIGNDRYISLIRIAQGAKISDLDPSVEKMRQDNLPLKELKAEGTDLKYTFTQLSEKHTSDPGVKQMSWIISLLAIVLVVSSVMNYLLIVIGNMVGRSKEMAVRKCYGAGKKTIYGIVFSEAFVHLVLSLLLAAVLIFVCKGTVEKLLNAPVSALLFNDGSWILVLVCLLVLFIGGLVPGWLYSSVPVSAAFRSYTQSRRHWKLVLLGVQFIAAGFLISLLFVINRQYKMMVDNNPGYESENLLTVAIQKDDHRKTAVEEFSKMGGVESVSSADKLLDSQQSGDNVYLPNDDRCYLNIADLFDVSDSYLKTMGIKVVQGKSFTEQTDSLKEVMVSRSFVDKMKLLAHWDDNVVGRRVLITSYEGLHTICGVYDDVRMGSLVDPDPRASVMFYRRTPCLNVIVKFHKLTPESLTMVQNKLKSLFPDDEYEVKSYNALLTDMYQSQYNFRKEVLIGGLVILFIALLGLIGYTNDEVNRRHKEIAIRKVNGAVVKDILQLFVRDILRIAVPALVIGGVAAWAVARKWLEQFCEKAPLSILLFVLSACIVLLIILAVVNLNCYKVSNSNPVDYLKGE